MATEANLAALPVHSVLINIPTSEIEDYSYKDITGDTLPDGLHLWDPLSSIPKVSDTNWVHSLSVPARCVRFGRHTPSVCHCRA